MASKPVSGGLGGHPGGVDRGGGRRRRKIPGKGRSKPIDAPPRERPEPMADSFERGSPAILNKPPKILQKNTPTEKLQPRVFTQSPNPEEFRSRPPVETPFKIKTRGINDPKTSQGTPETVVAPRQSTPGAITIATSKVAPPLRVNIKDDTRGRAPTPTHSPRPMAIEVPVHKRLSLPAEMNQSVKLVDESGCWCENGLEMLQDLNDYLVVGVLGMQGSGKSTIMSFLAGNTINDDKGFIFMPQSKEAILKASHQTVGIDFFVTKERILLLDTQPVLSASVLDDLLSHEKNLPPEYTSAENFADMQSLQLASFLMTVCHVVLVVVDWFPDLSLMEFLKRAEMLKPPTPSPPPSQTQDVEASKEKEDYTPSIAFVINKASPSDFHPTVVREAERSIASVLKNTKLKFQGCSSLSRANVMPSLAPPTLPLDVNLFLVPHFHDNEADITAIYNNGQSILYSLLPTKFKGHPRTETLVRCLRNQIYGAARSPLTHTSLTEKNWFHYAARTWETMRKSSLMSDFNRLLT